MSFETISIQRRQPVLDKRFIRVPGAEHGTSPSPAQPLLPAVDAVAGLNATSGNSGFLSFGRGQGYEFLPHYSKDINLDFITYEEVGTDGKVIGAPNDPVRDFQQELRDISSARQLYPAKVIRRC
jgi:hypothetical protein